MRTERFTLDSNVLVYALHREAGPKWPAAAAIVERAAAASCFLTLQAISEFYAVVTRKQLMVRKMAALRAEDFTTAFPTLSTSPQAVRNALALAGTGHVSWWDAVLIATAAEGGCSVILSEDFTAGATILGVRVERPFAEGAISPAAERLLAAG
jgi:predicted nucleic acid-binding protein